MSPTAVLVREARAAAGLRVANPPPLGRIDLRSEREMSDKPDFDFGAIVDAYESSAEPLTLPFGERALALLGIGAGQSVIDVACGTGGVAVAAAARGIRVLAVDGTPAMVARTAERLRPFPDTEARHMTCEALETPDGSFDAALSLFGVMILPQWREGLAELVRVTRRGGCVAVSAWADPGGPKTMTLLKGAFQTAFPGRTLLPREIDTWTEGAVRDALVAAGCAHVEVHLQQGELAAPSIAAMIVDSDPMFRMLPGYAALTDGERARLMLGWRDELEAFTAPDGSVHLPMPAFIAVGVVR